jgi:5-methylcytosine-specific restriction endonuclease McrA
VFYRRKRTRITPTRDEIYAMWAEWDAWACVYCGAPWEHVEHFWPLARSGTDDLSNLWPACALCNVTKADRDPWEYLRSLGVTDDTVGNFTHLVA